MCIVHLKTIFNYILLSIKLMRLIRFCILYSLFFLFKRMYYWKLYHTSQKVFNYRVLWWKVLWIYVIFIFQRIVDQKYIMWERIKAKLQSKRKHTTSLVQHERLKLYLYIEMWMRYTYNYFCEGMNFGFMWIQFINITYNCVSSYSFLKTFYSTKAKLNCKTLEINLFKLNLVKCIAFEY